MDSFSIIVLILVAFLAYQANIIYIFWGTMLLAAIFANKWLLRIVMIAAIIVSFFLPNFMKTWWIPILIVIGVLVLLINEKQAASGGGGSYDDYSSAELMKLLGNG